MSFSNVSPYYSQSVDSTAFVYESMITHETKVVYAGDSVNYTGRKDWRHIATIDPAVWIERLMNHPEEWNQMTEGLKFKKGGV